jgi:cardiolipin synthase
VVKDGNFAVRLRTSLMRAIDTKAAEINHAELERSGLLARGLRWLAYGAVRLMLGITRYGGNDYQE